MASRSINAFKVGVFVVVALIIVIATMFWAKGFYVYRDMRDLKVYFKMVTGLKKGDPVMVNGVIKGKVKDFNLEGDSVLVEFLLERDVKIKKDYKIEIVSTELLGGKTINISQGNSPEEIDYNVPLSGSKMNDILALINNVNELTEQVKGLIGNFNKAAEDLQNILASVDEVIGDPKVKNELKSTISNIQITSSNLNSLVSENKISLKNITDKTSGTIDKVNTTIDNVNTMLDENKPNIETTISEIKVLTQKIDGLVENLNGIVSNLQDKNKGVGKFIYDDKFFDNLNKVLIEIENLSKKIREEGVKINLF
ncbi:MAG: MlaD family protein [Ignavibacteria bacterium]|nr:MlaD family protein [Ignavibacteria bacterium]